MLSEIKQYMANDNARTFTNRKGHRLRKTTEVSSSVTVPKINKNSNGLVSEKNTTASSEDLTNITRKQRSQAEKKRRDKHNNSISELATLVPMINNAPKRPDKISILRLTAAYLRIYYSSLNSTNNRKKTFSWPKLLREKHFNDLLELVDGFFLFIIPSSKIIFISKSVECYIGHQDIDMAGHYLLDFIHPDDNDFVKEELQNLTESNNQNQNITSKNTAFCARLRERSQPRLEVISYQRMQFSCVFSPNEGAIRTNKRQSISDIQDQEGQAFSGLFKIHVKPLKINLLSELSITEAFQEEYITRHGPDGNILFADHRISTITGHLPHEVTGMLAYDYINPVDIPVAHFAHKLMFSSSNGTGIVIYRLKARDESMIFLKSIGHLKYDDTGTKINHFICVNKLLTSEEGKKELMKFRERYFPKIKEYMSLLQAPEKSELYHVAMCEALQNSLSPSENLHSISSTNSPQSLEPGLLHSPASNFSHNEDLSINSVISSHVSTFKSPDTSSNTSTPYSPKLYECVPSTSEIEDIFPTPCDTYVKNVCISDYNLGNVRKHNDICQNSVNYESILNSINYHSDVNCTQQPLQSFKRNSDSHDFSSEDIHSKKRMKYNNCEDNIIGTFKTINHDCENIEITDSKISFQVNVNSNSQSDTPSLNFPEEFLSNPISTDELIQNNNTIVQLDFDNSCNDGLIGANYNKIGLYSECNQNSQIFEKQCTIKDDSFTESDFDLECFNMPSQFQNVITNSVLKNNVFW